MIYIDGDKEIIKRSGDAARLTSELAGIMAIVYGDCCEELGEELGLALMIQTIKSAIEFRKIRTTDILETLRLMSELAEMG